MEKVVVRAIILNDKGEVLLAKRASGFGVNQWAFVGGKPKNGEELENAIKREVREELGLELYKVKLYRKEIDKLSVTGEIWSVYFFTSRFKGNIVIKKDELKDVKFVIKKDLKTLDIAFDHKERLLEFFETL